MSLSIKIVLEKECKRNIFIEYFLYERKIKISFFVLSYSHHGRVLFEFIRLNFQRWLQVAFAEACPGPSAQPRARDYMNEISSINKRGKCVPF